MAGALGVVLRPEPCHELVARDWPRVLDGEDGEERQAPTLRGSTSQWTGLVRQARAPEETKLEHEDLRDASATRSRRWDDGRAPT
jgi:hypothetical protein